MLQSSKARLQVEIDPDLKKAVAIRLKQIGLTEQDLLSSFLMYVYRNKSIPFERLSTREDAIAEATKFFINDSEDKKIKELQSQEDIDEWFDEDK